MTLAADLYTPDRSLKGKLRRRLVRLMERRPNPAALDRPMVSFSFDDAPASAALDGARALEARGLRGTYFISAGLAGEDSRMGRYASREQLAALTAAGHEIACHTYSHLDCGASDQAAIESDVARNDAVLAQWGARQTATFAYPYGDVSRDAKRALAKRFSLSRALHHGLIERGTDLNQAPSVGVEGSRGEAIAQRWIKRAADRRAWLILYTHDVAEAPSQWGCTPAALDRLIDAAIGLGCEVVTVEDGARRLAAKSQQAIR